MATMRELLERVKAATGPNYQLEVDIVRAFGGPLPDKFIGLDIKLEWQEDGSATMPAGGMQVRYTPPNCTASVDAALRLAEMALPGWEYSLTSVHTDFRCEGEPRFSCDLVGPVTWATDEGFPEPIFGGHSSGKAETPALAILVALLTALTENEDGA